MSTSGAENKERGGRAVGLVIGASDFTVCLADGRKVVVPYDCYPRLDRADMQQRAHFEVHADGRMLHWPEIDEDIEVQHIVDGRMPVRKDHPLMAVAEERDAYGETDTKAKGMRLALMLLCVAWATIATASTSETYAVVADAFVGSRSPLAVGSARYQSSVSVGQPGALGGLAAGGAYGLASGFQAMLDGLDTDGDGVPDRLDADSDGDGTSDAADGRPYDTDQDGANNLADADDDNDRLSDVNESEFGTSWVKANTDGDGADDYEEWVAGTDGTDPDDFFGISSVSHVSGHVLLTWQGVAGRTYRVWATDDLPSAPAMQQLGATSVVVSAAVQFRDTSPPEKRFYRLDVARP